MHDNEPIIAVVLLWAALIVFCGFRSHAYITGSGPARGFRIIYFVFALLWLLIWGGGIIAAVFVIAIVQYPVPSISQMVDRFDDSVFDIVLGCFGLAMPLLTLPVIWLAEIGRSERRAGR